MHQCSVLVVCVSVCTTKTEYASFSRSVHRCSVFVVYVSVCTGVQFLWPVFQCAPVFSFCGFVFECAPVFSFCGLLQCAPVFSFCGLSFSVHWCSVFVVCVSVCTGVQFLWFVFQCAQVFRFLWFVFQCAQVFSFCGLCFSVHTAADCQHTR